MTSLYTMRKVTLVLVLAGYVWCARAQSGNGSNETEPGDPIREHLALIIGVPTGVGLSLLGLGLCVLWLGCSSFKEYRKNRPDVSAGTHSTNVAHKGNTFPMKGSKDVGSTSAGDSKAFQPEPDVGSGFAETSFVPDNDHR